jgi:hypothetical protein
VSGKIEVNVVICNMPAIAVELVYLMNFGRLRQSLAHGNHKVISLVYT